jgi:hypothetical protein
VPRLGDGLKSSIRASCERCRSSAPNPRAPTKDARRTSRSPYGRDKDRSHRSGAPTDGVGTGHAPCECGGARGGCGRPCEPALASCRKRRRVPRCAGTRARLSTN